MRSRQLQECSSRISAVTSMTVSPISGQVRVHYTFLIEHSVVKTCTVFALGLAEYTGLQSA